jgi:magnesium transporter
MLKRLLIKELGIAVLNGLMWGSMMGAITYLLYGNLHLALVMSAAMLLSLIVAAVAGFLAPIVIVRLGHDPAFGAHVLLTFITDSMGFLIFLGLATLFLM